MASPKWFTNLWKFLNQPDPSDTERIERWEKEVAESKRIEEAIKETCVSPPHIKSKQKGVKY